MIATPNALGLLDYLFLWVKMGLTPIHWMRSGTKPSQFLSVFLPILASYLIVTYMDFNTPVLHIRGDIEDNSKIFFLISRRKHIL